MRIAVVGGGVFGATIAIDLARASADVELFEARSDIVDGSSARNQARLHSGYHYPRSAATAAAARAAAEPFAERFPQAIRRSAQHWYVVAPGSKVSPADYLAFLDDTGLPYQVAGGRAGPDRPAQVHTADLVVRVPEAFVDVPVLRRLLRGDLARSGVTVHTGHRVDAAEVAGFDATVWATYGTPWPQPLRFEVCEVALLGLGRYGEESFVVVDGDFVSLDPHGRIHALYDVTHSVHHVSIGTQPEIPPEYADLIARNGVVRSPLSHIDQMIESASRYLWGLHPGGMHTSIYHGSMWSLRAVLPDVDSTDERPTLVRRDGNTIRVLSGKICTAAAVGQAVVDEVFGLVPA